MYLSLPLSTHTTPSHCISRSSALSFIICYFFTCAKLLEMQATQSIVYIFKGNFSIKWKCFRRPAVKYINCVCMIFVAAREIIRCPKKEIETKLRRERWMDGRGETYQDHFKYNSQLHVIKYDYILLSIRSTEPIFDENFTIIEKKKSASKVGANKYFLLSVASSLSCRAFHWWKCLSRFFTAEFVHSSSSSFSSKYLNQFVAWQSIFDRFDYIFLMLWMTAAETLCYFF